MTRGEEKCDVKQTKRMFEQRPNAAVNYIQLLEITTTWNWMRLLISHAVLTDW